MSNSALANYVNRLSGKCSSRPSGTLIDRITIHCAFASGDCYDLTDLIASANDSSYHYGITTDGTVCLFVDEEFRSWSTGNDDNDNRAVNIICMTTPNSDSLSDNTYNALLDLCTDICRRNYMTRLIYRGELEGSTLTIHKWFADVNCPGQWLVDKMYSIAASVSSRLSMAAQAASEAEALKAQSTISVGAIKPYFATIAHDKLNTDYDALKSFGVIGCAFWAGSRFDEQHHVRPKYDNPNIKKQIAEINTIEMPYALYATCRARTVQEAKDECYYLYFVISKYPPKLGLWFNLELLGNTTTRKEIVDVYYSYAVKWGLKDKCGLYATRDQLISVEYKTYLDKFAIWLISPMDNLASLESLFTPALFKF